MKSKRSRTLIVLVILSLEKFVQHMTVTYAFWKNLSGIQESVSFDYRFFMISGFLVGILFLANIPFLIQRKRFSFRLLLFLALFDFIGEFVAQGPHMLDITVSFLVALLILLILILNKRQFFNAEKLAAMG